MAKQILAALLLLSIAGVHVLGVPTERPPPGGYPSHCAPFSCTRQCPNGHVDDDRGCQTCQCKDRPKTCQPANCPRNLNCPRGYQKDQYGCDICRCNPGGPVCPQVVCPRPCTNGYVIRDGCQTCDCIPVDACYDRCRGYCSTRKGRPAGCTCNCGDDRRP